MLSRSSQMLYQALRFQRIFWNCLLRKMSLLRRQTAPPTRALGWQVLPAPAFLGSCRPNLPKFNWREQGMSTPIVDQKACGSCWAFSTAATFDTSYRIRNAADITVSQQDILDCANDSRGRSAGSCNGGWYNSAFQWLVAKGVVSDADAPYLGRVQKCLMSHFSRYRAISWGFVSTQKSVPLIRDIKTAICEYGAVSAAINATPAFQAYAGGIFNEHDLGTVTKPVNHAITILGWDDNADGAGNGAWLVQNSWTAQWGDNGYVWVNFDSNNVGYAAAWVRPATPNVTVEAGAIGSAWQQLASVSKGLSTYEPRQSSSGIVSNTPYKSIVWIQYGGQSQKANANKVRQALTAHGYFAPAVDDVYAKQKKLPDLFQVRFFNPASQAKASAVAEIIKAAGLGSVIVKQHGNDVKQSGVEVWFPAIHS